ncbi:MAG: polysaccharide biosynthesis C-terminal domain-containing protein [Pseudomonadota bacterium]|nr:polysaccharide biosynthesis C-terminal domain-containing protein [Pseudomonadota bacterium]
MTTSMSRRILNGALVGWGSQVVGTLLRLLLTPMLFASLTRVEVGTWYLLGSTISALQLAEFGMLTALTRRIAMAKGRVDLGSEEGVRGAAKSELIELIEIGRVSFRWRALFALVAGLSVGSVYILSLDLEEPVRDQALAAWGILVAGHCLQIYFGYLSAIIMGLGLVASGATIGGAVAIAMTLGQIGIVMGGGGLVGLAMVAVAGPLALKQLQLWLLRRGHPALLSERAAWNQTLFVSMVRPALTTWLTTASFFAISRVDNFFITSHLGLHDVARFQPAIQVCTAIQMAALMLANTSGFFISQTWGVRDEERIRRMLSASIRFALFFLAAGLAVIIGVSDQLFLSWLGDADLISTPIIIALAVKVTLEGLVHIYVNTLRSIENDRSSFIYVLAACLNLPLTWLLIQRYGLIGVAASTFLAQVLTVGPFVLYEARRQFALSIRRTLVMPALEALPLFGCCLVAAIEIRACMAGAGRLEALAVVLASAAVAGVMLAFAVYIRVLTPAQRHWIAGIVKW